MVSVFLSLVSIFCDRRRILLIGCLSVLELNIVAFKVPLPITSFGPVSAEEKHTVPLAQIVNGGPPPDGIPSIDSPKFSSVEDGNKFLDDSDKILGININGDIRAYPLQ